MQKSTTDIDRKLAIYYHPLFQQTMYLLTNLFEMSSQNQEQSNNKNKTKNQNQNQAKQSSYYNNTKNSFRDVKKFDIGLMQFIEFNLKLQKCLLPSFQAENAIISALNDWVKEVAQCLNYQGMVKTTQCQEVTQFNFENLLRAQINSSKMQLYEGSQKYIKTLSKLKNHDAFKLLGVKVNKQVFSKFMFDLCSTWCQFLDIEMFSYFLIAVYLQMSEGPSISQSQFKSTHLIQPIDLQFMEQFQIIKQSYSRQRKKQLRYYRAWCQWNYLRVGEIGEALILCLDNILEDDKRVLDIGLIFEKAIRVINQEITSQSQYQTPKDNKGLYGQYQKSDKQKGDFLIMKKLNTKQNTKQLYTSNNKNQKSLSISNNNNIIENEQTLKNKSIDSNSIDYNSNDLHKNNNIKGHRLNLQNINNQNKQSIQSKSIQDTLQLQNNNLKNQTISAAQEQARELQRRLQPTQGNQNNNEQDQNQQHHDFQIQIDQFGNMYLKKIVKLPILGSKIELQSFNKKQQARQNWIQKKSQECRQISNLYRRLENMKVRLQHNVRRDHYYYKKNPKIAERDKFYQIQNKNKTKSSYIHGHTNYNNQDEQIFQKAIHQKVKPENQLSQEQNIEPNKTSINKMVKTVKNNTVKQPIRKNADYIHKIMAPSFLTDHKNNLSYLQQKQGTIYGTGAQDQRRDIKINLPKIKFLKDIRIKDQKSYHIIGKLTKDRSVINQKIQAIMEKQKINQQKPLIRPLGIETQSEKIQHLKDQYRHVWTKFINQQQIKELKNFNDFYKQLQKCKKLFSHQNQSSYRYNLKPILLYQNRRYQMGGVLTRNQQQKFYEKMKKLIQKDQKRKKKREKKNKFRQYKNTFKNKNQRSFFQEVFVEYHKNQIKNIKQERVRIKSLMQKSNTVY